LEKRIIKRKGQIMKVRLAVLCCLVCVVMCSSRSIWGGAKSEVDPVSRAEPGIAVVRVLEIMQETAQNDKKHLQELMSLRNEARTELEQRAKEMEVEEADLKTLKADSDDYMKQLDVVLEKKGRYESRKEFLERQIAVKQQIWTRAMYNEALRITREVAAQRGLRLVLAADQVDLPASESLVNLIATQKVLYSDGCPDLTDEVRARLLARDSR
jgi:Skp family chaperone for outer membrane proteins